MGPVVWGGILLGALPGSAACLPRTPELTINQTMDALTLLSCVCKLSYIYITYNVPSQPFLSAQPGSVKHTHTAAQPSLRRLQDFLSSR